MCVAAEGCDREANSRGLCRMHYMRLYRARLTPRFKERPAVTDVDALLVACWCEEGFVRIPRAEVLAGRTRSCGRKGCRR